MNTRHTPDALAIRLDESPVRRRFVGHPFFRNVDAGKTTRHGASILVGQWWHPLHYFPTFLARCVAVLPDIESKSAITRILNQEAGGGNARQAHEVIYIYTMEGAGFAREQITGAAPFEETAALVKGYERLSRDPLSALGSIFATEVTDLLMVSSIGKAVAHATGVRELEWVDIHVQQEPDHVEEANHSLMGGFDDAAVSRVVESADEMWRLWTGFFDRLQRDIAAPAQPLAAAAA